MLQFHRDALSNANTGETALSGASNFQSAISLLCVVTRIGARQSERAQQHGADEREHGEHGQHVEPQGKVHVTLPVLLGTTKV
jgi:hypothetical protein